MPKNINPTQTLKERVYPTFRVSTVKAINLSFLNDSSNTESDCHKNNHSTDNQKSENSKTQKNKFQYSPTKQQQFSKIFTHPILKDP
jgi:hypothetical protein